MGIYTTIFTSIFESAKLRQRSILTHIYILYNENYQKVSKIIWTVNNCPLLGM